MDLMFVFLRCFLRFTCILAGLLNGGKCVAKYSSTMWHTGMLYVLALLEDFQGNVVQYTMHE